MPNPKSTAEIAGHPIHTMLISFPIVFFCVRVCVCDVVFWRTAESMWGDRFDLVAGLRSCDGGAGGSDGVD